MDDLRGQLNIESVCMKDVFALSRGTVTALLAFDLFADPLSIMAEVNTKHRVRLRVSVCQLGGRGPAVQEEEVRAAAPLVAVAEEVGVRC